MFDHSENETKTDVEILKMQVKTNNKHTFYNASFVSKMRTKYLALKSTVEFNI